MTPAPAPRFAPLAAALFAIALFAAVPLYSQAPNASWRTLHTTHVRVHYVEGMEELAHRTAANAESAWTRISEILRPPRGPVDIVLSDDVDFSNGFATPLPTNRVTVYAAPPVDPGALRFTDDWNALVVTHELAHVFHLDRSRGVWRLAQRVLGRAPFLFPNLFGPAWLTEGLAVWFESEITGAGRLRGTEHEMIARAAALAHRVPRLDELSLSTPRFPGGQATYAYGSLFIDYLARERGSLAIRDFVESQSVQVIPLWISRAGRSAFGDPFGRAWQRWVDSLVASVGEDRPPLTNWQPLIRGQIVSAPPRWSHDTLLNAGTPGRYPFAIQRVLPNGEVKRGPRRWSVSPQVPLPNGGVLYSQIDYRDLYHLRSDLWIERDGERRRITTGARLTSPDVRADGRIVAVQAVPGGTRLVHLNSDGTHIAPITTGGPDTNWTEPRWSPSGDRIAAVRWTRGGLQQLLVLDSLGRSERIVHSARAVIASPTWTPDGNALLFSSDEGGRPNILSVGAAGGSVARGVTNAATGVLFPEVSRDGTRLAAVHFRADGYEVGVGTLPADAAPTSATSQNNGAVRIDSSRLVAYDRQSATRSTKYSPWRTLLPRWWLPLIESGLGGGTRLGALTGGNDVIGRHSYGAEVLVPTNDAGVVGDFTYRYAGLGQPLLDFSIFQDWTRRGNISSNQVRIGELRRRVRDASVAATLIRPRMRSSSSLTMIGGVEERVFATDPESLLVRLNPRPVNSVRPRVLVGASYSRTDAAPWSISPEDGFVVSGSALRRWTRGVASSGSHTGIASVTGYKSLDLPGFSRHVLAARVAAGATDRKTISALEVGGTSGGFLSVLPGYVVGEGRETFGVRGFASNSISGIRATSASVEYRAPLRFSARGVGLLPLFLDRSSLSLFAESGSAWCPADQNFRGVCIYTGPDTLPTESSPSQWQTLASVGAELHINAAVLSWDTPYRFRFGVAMPVKGRDWVGADRVSVYLAVGLAY